MNRIPAVNQLRQRIATALCEAAVSLEEPLMGRLRQALETEQTSGGGGSDSVEASIEVLKAILENLELSKKTRLPMCQDTGMVLAFIDVGPDCPLSMNEVAQALDGGVSDAVASGWFRHSVVDDPLFDRTNTASGLPAVVHWRQVDSGALTVHMMLKGFGCENCCAVRMLNPTATVDEVVRCIGDIVRLAGGKPCPPVVLGIGIGGTMDQAAVLSKRALCRPVGEHHHDERYAALERSIMEEVQRTRIGAGGFGGMVTALWAAVEYFPTHIAGLPVAVSISCWADRKAIVHFGGDHDA